jgi:hypothetical protein
MSNAFITLVADRVEPGPLPVDAAGNIINAEAEAGGTRLVYFAGQVALDREFGIVGGAGSDGHVPDALGSAYVEMDDFATPMEFLASLANSTVIGHHWDEPRPWSPRIVPSVT